MKMIVGLGNPGARYAWTRHNIGFLALDFFAKRYDFSWGDKLRYGAVTGLRGDVLFVKPQEFYNESGKAVGALARYYKIAPEDILVICDNFDLGFGVVRYKRKGSAGGNNGLKSVDLALGGGEYPRIRVGTGNDEVRGQVGDVKFVLSKFTVEEKGALPGVFTEVERKILEFAGGEF